MHKVIVACALIFLMAPMTNANATERGTAQGLCKKNPRCHTILSNDDGDIFCIRQADGSCVVIVCPEILDCYVFRTVPRGGSITLTTAVAKDMFDKKGTAGTRTVAGVRRALTR
jgi:hypothetical protein